MTTQFLSPVGRLVQGNPFEGSDKDRAGRLKTTKTGQPKTTWFCGVAFKKTDPLFTPFYQQLVNEARTAFPTMFDASGNCTRPNFAMKIVDGDGFDDDGKPNANKPGFAGHWIVKFSSGFAPKCFYAGRYAPHEQITDPKAIPRGYYVRVAGSVEGNADTSKPGIYVNLHMVELVGGQASDVIASGPDAAAVFGGQTAQLPPGVAAAVLPPTGPQLMPGAPMAAGLPGLAPAVGSAALPAVPMAAAPVAVLPNPAILQAPAGVPALPQGLPGAPSAPIGALPSLPAVAPPPEPQVTQAAAALGHTYATLKAQGHSDDQLRAAGYIV